MTQLLLALLNRPCTANTPVDSVMLRAGGFCQAQTPPISGVQPLEGCGSVWLEAYSLPSTILTPSSRPARPGLMKFAPQLAPASVMYGKFVYAIVPPDDDVALWYEQKVLPNPGVLWSCDVATTYEALLLKPKWASSLRAS